MWLLKRTCKCIGKLAFAFAENKNKIIQMKITPHSPTPVPDLAGAKTSWHLV